MAGRPIAVFAMHPVVMEQIVRPDHIERLQRCCALPRQEAVRHYEQLTEFAPQIEILITSWGCAPVTQDVLERLPKLKLIAHLAGSVKGFVDGSAWARGIQVTNAVAANAVPVAEYTLAAILFANKRVLQLRDFYRRHHENRAPWTKEAPNVGNYRKRVGTQVIDEVQRATGRVAEALLPVLDACEAAFLQHPAEVEPIFNSLLGELRKLGLEAMNLFEKPFDPALAEAVVHEAAVEGNSEGGEPIVSEVLRSGYTWNGRVLRPAMVKVKG